MNTIIRTRQLRDRRNTVSLGVLAVIASLMIWLNACSSGSPREAKTNKAATPASAAVTTEASVPTSLSNAGEYGENIYDYAKANDWKNANVKLVTLRDEVKNVRTNINGPRAALDRLEVTVAAVDRAVTAKDRQATMREANQVTLEIANLTTAYKPTVPVEVTKLDYYGRELEVWAQAQDANKLQATAREMRRTWDSLRPTVESLSPTRAKKFDALVARVESAKKPADYARVATPVLDEVDNLEKLFP